MLQLKNKQNLLLSNKKSFICLVVILFTILFTYKDLPQTFYQQDEWYGLGLAFAEGGSSIFSGISRPLDFLFVKGRIFSNLIFYLFSSYFPLQNIQMAIFAILLHIIATFLVFILVEKFIHNRFVSLLGALFFAVNAVSHGAVTWSLIAINTVTSTIIVLLGILFFFKYKTDSHFAARRAKAKWLILSGVMVYLSLWFKETGLYIFLFLPLGTLLFKRYSLISFFKTFWTFFLPFILIVTYRIIELKLRTTTSNLYITGLNENFFSTIFLRAILYPLTSFSLMFVPGDQFLSFAREVQDEVYPFLAQAGNNILIAQTAILDLLAIILTFLILFCIILLLKKEKFGSKRTLLFWLMFSFMSFLPYVVLSKDFSYLEGRYYYLSAVGGAVLLSWVVKRLWEILNPRIFYLIILPFVVFYIIFHASVVRGAITEQVRLSNLRKDFIMQLKTFVPTLDNKRQVFYTTSDQNYWDDGNKIPFQQGSGYTFMVLYYGSGKIPKEFLKEGFLFEIGSQGYKQIGEYGFGYFWDKEKLEKVVKQYNLPQSSIIKLEYNSKTGNLRRIE